MKKKILIPIVLLAGLSLYLMVHYGDKALKESIVMDAGTYFPPESTVMTYNGGYENTGYTTTYLGEIDTYHVMKFVDGAGVRLKLYTITEDGLTLVALVSSMDDMELSDQLSRSDLEALDLSKLGDHGYKQRILPKEVVVGYQWYYGDDKYEIKAINMSVEVAHGTYPAIEVMRYTPKGDLLKYYYSPSMGLIKETGFDLVSELVNVDTGALID